jgi:hypothetical protein
VPYCCSLSVDQDSGNQEATMDVEAIVEEDLSDWQLVLHFLPEGWREKARQLGALRRAKKFESSGCLLRTLMIHLAEGCSLKETAVRASDAGLADVSSVAIWKRLRSSGEWLRWMAEAVMKQWVERLPGDLLPGPYRLRLVDASAISEPGSTGSDWRIHYAVELGALQCDFIKVTDVTEGETFKHFPVHKGDLLIADRIYANRAGIEHVVDHEGDVLVRTTLTNLPLETESRRPFPLLRRLETLRVGEIGQWPCWIRRKRREAERIAARICAVKRSRVATAIARKKLLQRASKKGQQLRPDTLKAAAYVFVLTTVPSDCLGPAPLLEVYRGRWQVELVFKRLKSILLLSHLPKRDPQGARAWLHGKILVAFLVEALIHAGESFFPWGYPLEPQGAGQQ